jgi:putative membrane protein
MARITGATSAGAPGTAYAAASGDSAFVAQAAQGGMAEVKLAALAMKRSKNPTVLAFARRMNTDHTKNNAQLAAIAKAEGRTLPTTVGIDNMGTEAKLEVLRGNAFDHAYLTSQVAGHQKMLALMQTEASSGTDPKLVAFAKATIPTVKQHLALAQSDIKQGSSM